MRKDCKVCGSLNRSTHHRMKCFKGTKFIRIVKKSCARQLRLPASFARKGEEFLEDGAILYGEGTDTWRVQVMRHSRRCSFGKGWKAFPENYKVCKGAVLLFENLGYSGFKVDVFDGRTGVTPVRDCAGGEEDGKASAADNNVVPQRVGRPPIVYEESAKVSAIELYGMKLRSFASYNMRGELQRREIPVHGCKAALVERLGSYILQYGEEVDEPEVKIEPVWPW